MSMEAVAKLDSLTPFEQLRHARQIIQQESQSLARLAGQLDDEFCYAARLIFECRGNVIVSGMGKAGLIGQKIMATLASTGTPSHCLHPAEAVHGDLGRVHCDDAMLILSQSGETEEIIRILPSLVKFGVPIIAITAQNSSTLARAATAVIQLGAIEEACSLGLAPSTSTTTMLAVGDALALVVSRMRRFGREDFARFHPAGSLGRKLSKVEEHMRPLQNCRVAPDQETVREVIINVRVAGRRTGATMLTNQQGELSGIFTDSDLARLFEQHADGKLDNPIRDVMTADPMTVTLGSKMTDAVDLMADHKISELPVTDTKGRPVGLLDITDVVALFPRKTTIVESEPAVTVRVFPEPQTGERA